MRIISGKARGTKLFALSGLNTRPTLDRVKEPLFDIINFKLKDAVVLDLFAGSGALGLEAISRGAKKAIFVENNQDAKRIIERNIEKTKFGESSLLINLDYKKAISCIAEKKLSCDVVFIDPPYKTDLIKKSLIEIKTAKILKNNAIIILETDEPERIKEEIKNLDVEIVDDRKYGRVSLIFLKQI